MISVFDTHPVVFESNDRTLTISYNGVLCKDANGTLTRSWPMILHLGYLGTLWNLNIKMVRWL